MTHYGDGIIHKMTVEPDAYLMLVNRMRVPGNQVNVEIAISDGRKIRGHIAASHPESCSFTLIEFDK